MVIISAVFMMFFAATSASASLFVICLYNMYPSLQKVSFNSLIYFICISDFFSSVGMALGHTRDGSVECWIQGLLTNIFPVSGVFWTTILAYMVYMNINKQTPIDVFSWQCYAVCWGVPVVLSLLPLSTNTYGFNGSGDDRGWCFIVERSDSPSWTLTFWVFLSFYFWMWGAIVLYYCLFVGIVLELRRISSAAAPLARKESSDDNMEMVVLNSLRKFAWYPLNILLCWTLPCAIDILWSLGVHRFDGAYVVNPLSDITPALLGLFNVVAFLRTNREVCDAAASLLLDRKDNRTKSAVEKQIEKFNKSFGVEDESFSPM